MATHPPLTERDLFFRRTWAELSLQARDKTVWPPYYHDHEGALIYERLPGLAAEIYYYFDTFTADSRHTTVRWTWDIELGHWIVTFYAFGPGMGSGAPPVAGATYLPPPPPPTPPLAISTSEQFNVPLSTGYDGRAQAGVMLSSDRNTVPGGGGNTIVSHHDVKPEGGGSMQQGAERRQIVEAKMEDMTDKMREYRDTHHPAMFSQQVWESVRKSQPIAPASIAQPAEVETSEGERGEKTPDPPKEMKVRKWASRNLTSVEVHGESPKRVKVSAASK